MPARSRTRSNVDGRRRGAARSHSPREHFEAHVAQAALEALIEAERARAGAARRTRSTRSASRRPSPRAAGSASRRDVVGAGLGRTGRWPRRGAYGDKLVAELEFPGKERTLLDAPRRARSSPPRAPGSADGRATVERRRSATPARDRARRVPRGRRRRRRHHQGGVPALDRPRRSRTRTTSRSSRSWPSSDGRDAERVAPARRRRAGCRTRARSASRARRSSRRSTWRSASPAPSSTWPGMREADTIIAVNTDPEAPIFTSRTTGRSPTCSTSPRSSSSTSSRRADRRLPLAAEKTREVFWHFPAWARGPVVRAGGRLGAASSPTASRGPLAKYRRGQRRAAAAALGAAAGACATARGRCSRTRTIGARDPLRRLGAPRRSSTASSSLFIGTVILAINTDVTERFFGWRFFKGDFYLGYSIVLDVLGLALLAGVRADDGPPRGSSGRASSTTRARTARPATRSTTGASYRVGDWMFVGVAARTWWSRATCSRASASRWTTPGYDAFSPARLGRRRRSARARLRRRAP